MSLWNIQTVAPCMGYEDFGDCIPEPGPPLWGPLGLTYNGYLLTCPRHYKESTITGMTPGFFYNPGTDRLVLFTWLSQTPWPSWSYKRYEFDAETGAQAGDTYGTEASFWGGVYSSHPSLGSFNKIYSCRACDTTIPEVSSETLIPVEGGWSVDPYKDWNPKSIYFHAMVNRVDNYLVGVQSWTLDCWRNINTTPELFAQLRLPNTLGYLAYESRNYCWVITQDGVILKADYTTPRWEMMSTVQDPAGDTLKYLITFDTKRHRVVVFRLRPDAVDGACQHQMEFYYPMVKAAHLTQPVPVTSLRGGNRITLVANLIGDAGEGITPYTVYGSMVAPVEGRLVTPFSGTGLNGAVGFQYQAPEAACTETLQLAVTVEEGVLT